MNIFVLDNSPSTCAKYHCDSHLVKMITEHNQILGSIKWHSIGVLKKKDISPSHYSFFAGFPRKHEDGTPHPYGIGYMNHPCTVWARECLENFEWLCQLTLEMCNEYTRRYKKIHKGEYILKWYYENKPHLKSLGQMTPFVQAMPTDVKNETDAVSAYRNYYIKYKTFAKWKHSDIPHWYKL